jgi:putative transposase
MPIKEIGRKHGFRDASFYKWRSKYGSMDASEAKRLRELELENGKLKRLRVRRTWTSVRFTVADDFTRECVDITADFGIGGAYVTRLLDRAAAFCGYPKAVRTDNGPEFTCRAFMTWALKYGIRHILIEPGSPTQNAYIESFNGTFRDECLHENWFESLEQARQIIAIWRTDYNETRPHSSCGRIPPATLAALNRQLTGDSKQKGKTNAGIS